MLEDPGEIELLLPWHAAGALALREARRVDEALASDPDLARQYAAMREECAETITLNESLGAPSQLVMQRLLSAIDAEPERRSRAGFDFDPVFDPSPRLPSFLARLSPHALAWSAGLGAALLLLLGGLVGGLVGSRSTASGSDPTGLADLDLGRAAAPHALVRFAEDARVADVRALLDKYQASIIGSTGSGMFRLQFGDRAMSTQDQAGVINDLSSEKIVNVATPAS